MVKPVNTLSAIIKDQAIKFTKETLENPTVRLALAILASMAGLGALRYPKVAMRAGCFVMKLGTDPRFLAVTAAVFQYADKVIAQRQIAERDKQLTEGAKQIRDLTTEVADLSGITDRVEAATSTLEGMTTEARVELLEVAKNASAIQKEALKALQKAEERSAAADATLERAETERAAAAEERSLAKTDRAATERLHREQAERLEAFASRMETMLAHVYKANPMAASLFRTAIAMKMQPAATSA